LRAISHGCYSLGRGPPAAISRPRPSHPWRPVPNSLVHKYVHTPAARSVLLLCVISLVCPCGAGRKARSVSAARLPAAHGEPATVALPDEIDVDTAPGAWLDLMAALRAGPGMVIAGMTGTVLCDGTGAGMLAVAHREAVTGGAQLRIAASPPRATCWR
jgi:hypothetical protein